MKKLILSSLLLIASSLPFSAFAASPFGHCPVTASNSAFCRCFNTHCNRVLGSGLCQRRNLIAYFNRVGIPRACSASGRGADRQECINGINHFIKVC